MNGILNMTKQLNITTNGNYCQLALSNLGSSYNICIGLKTNINASAYVGRAVSSVAGKYANDYFCRDKSNYL